MIISHKYKFIFIKTSKVGGTSLEIALSRFLGPEDVITPIGWPDEKERYYRGYPTAQNFEKRFRSLKVRDIHLWFRSNLLSRVTRGERCLRAQKQYPKLYWGHMPASSIREYCGQSVWDSYYKFTVERNPWDKVVSRYFFDPKKKKQGLGFREFIFSGRALKSDFERYCLNGIVAVDRLIRYDQLHHEMDEVSNILGFPGNVSETLGGVSAKGNYRKNRNVVDYYDQETRKIVEIFFAREIRLLGFTYGE